MSESIDLVVIVVVATTGIPSLDVRIRAELNHGVWTGGTGEGVSMKTGPDEGINMLCLIQ